MIHNKVTQTSISNTLSSSELLNQKGSQLNELIIVTNRIPNPGELRSSICLKRLPICFLWRITVNFQHQKFHSHKIWMVPVQMCSTKTGNRPRNQSTEVYNFPFGRGSSSCNCASMMQGVEPWRLPQKRRESLEHPTWTGGHKPPYQWGGTYPHSWMVYFMENPISKWMT
jgi:hypothetical protein